MYDFSFYNVVLMLLRTILCRPQMVAWLHSLVTPLEELRLVFSSFREEVKLKVAVTFQTIRIEKLLNDVYDPINQDIEIMDNQEEIIPIFIYNNEEITDDLYLYNDSEWSTLIPEDKVYAYNEEEYAFSIDFFVKVPTMLYDNMVITGAIEQMKSVINYYKMAGKNYEIIPY